MESGEILINKYTQLPANLQVEVQDFVDFLLSKINKTLFPTNDEPTDLTQKQKDTLVRRYESLEKEPDNGIKWHDAKQILENKYKKK